MDIHELKQHLNRVFDDNLHTKQWENYIDYAIIGLIIISTLQIFLSTFSYMEQHIGALLKWIDYITVVIFTIEVTLRIWCADLLDDKYKGFMGRVRYCFSFYGFIDFVSTYSFYMTLFFPIPYNILKVLRVARLLRIFRYMKAFTILNRAVSSKKDEMTVSLQFLIIITLMLSFILFFVEHEAQPQVYSNGWTSVLWAFAQYIGDPGNFADTPPITVTGRMIACIIGILGIAIFAVPAGLIASGFSDAMAEMNEEDKTNRNIKRIKDYFYSDYYNMNNEPFWPMQFEKLSRLESNLHLSYDDIIKATEIDNELRIVNFVYKFPDEIKGEPLAVEMPHVNTDYGFCSLPEKKDGKWLNVADAPSNILIISFLGKSSSGTSYLGYHLARVGRFNFISNEFMEYDAPEEENRFTVQGIYEDLRQSYPKLGHYVDDILRLTDENSWIIIVAKTINKDFMVRLRCCGKEGDEVFRESETNTVTDVRKLQAFYNDLGYALKSKKITYDYGLLKSKDTYLSNWLHNHGRKNVFEIDFNREFLFSKKNPIMDLARLINKHFETRNKYGIDTIPMKELPCLRSRKSETIRLTRKVKDYSEICFESIDMDSKYIIGLVPYPSNDLNVMKPDGTIIKADVKRLTFDESKRQMELEKNTPKQKLYRSKGNSAFTLFGKLEENTHIGKYKCTISHYNSDVTLTYEFRNRLKLLDVNNSFNTNSFDANKICINTENVNFFNKEPFNGKLMLHTDEVMYDGMVVDGQSFIPDRDAVETEEFYIEISNQGECHIINENSLAEQAETKDSVTEEKNSSDAELKSVQEAMRVLNEYISKINSNSLK